MGRLFMLKARMGTSTVLMFVVLSAFIFVLSTVILFLFYEITSFLQYPDSSSLFDFASYLSSLGFEIDDLTALYLELQSFIMILQYHASFFAKFLFPQNFVPMIMGVSIFTLFFILFEWAIGPSLVARSLNLKYLSKGHNPWLQKTVGVFAEKSGLPKPKIAVWSSEQPNAFVFGRTAGSATLVVSEGLLKSLNQEEVSAVIGHEVGHLKHKDYLVMTCLSAVPVLCYMIAMAAFYGSGGKRAVILIPLAIFALIIYIATLIVVRTLSRQREFYSDAYSAYVTEDPRGLRSALTKIAYGLSLNPQITHGARAFFIEDPANAKDQIQRIVERKSEYDLDKDGTLDEKELELAMEAEAKRTKWNGINNLFSTHPPTYKRILLLSQIEKEMSSGIYTVKNIYKKV